MAIEMARLSQSSSQSIPASTDTKVNFDSLAFDTTSGRMPSVANSNLTASTPGAYLITGSIRFNPASRNADKLGTAARIRNTYQQGIPDNTDTQVTFNTADWDTSIGNTMTGNTPSALTCVGTGIHVLSGHLRFASGGTNSGDSEFFLAIRLNGTVVQSSNVTTPGTNADLTVATVIGQTAGDTTELWFWQGTGYGQNTDTGFGGATLAMVGPLDYGGSERYLSIWKNGNTNLRQTEANNYITIQQSALSVASITSLAQGDTIDLRCFQSSPGGALGTAPTFGDIHLSMALLSPS